jgi:hypothetical protein
MLYTRSWRAPLAINRDCGSTPNEGAFGYMYILIDIKLFTAHYSDHGDQASH